MKRTVLITGSTRGIGLATAAEFLKQGDRVAVFCRHKGHAEQAAKHLLNFGEKENILNLTGDVHLQKDVIRIIDQCLKHFGHIDVLVNNAGVAVYKMIEETTEEEWDRIINTNLKGTFLFLHQVIPLMKEQGTGIIINVSSGLGVEGMSNFSAYCASKFGVVGLTEAIADELTLSGIRIYAVLPGAVATGLLAGSDFQMDPSEMLQPDHVARKIVETARGKKRSGSLVTVYS
jgi:3-oxoacyl-[acyl-carrier protein] reductase